MDTADLKEYLGMVVDMEKNIFLQGQTMKTMTEKINQLGNPIAYTRPTPPEIKERKSDASFVVMAIIGILPIAWGMRWIRSKNLAFLAAIGIFMGGLFLLTTVISAISCRSDDKKEAERVRREQIEYDRNYQEYQRLIRKDRQRVNMELIEKAALSADLQKLQAQNMESRQRLERVYTANVIFPKYRNLTMVCSLYEYICAGRCDVLEGHEGAYNILEMEIRLDRVITQLDQVIAKLGAIQANQFMLYSAIQESNRQSAQILESTQRMADQLQGLGTRLDSRSAEFQAQLADLQKSSALAAYQAERTQKELHYMNRMNYLSGKYDDVFFNLPPT